MSGKRIRTTRYAARHLMASRSRGHRRRTPSAEDRALWKIVICGAVFVLIVVLRLLFPDTVNGVAQAASCLIGRDADFVEAFSAIGRAAGGENPVGESLEDAYAAVFSATSVDEMEEDGSNWTDEKESLLSVYSFETEAEKLLRDRTMEDEKISYSGMVLSLPENASLIQKNLGFNYVTPVKGVLSSSFGWRKHPLTGETRFHYGVDLAAETGTEIFAFADGEVFAVGESSTLGKYVIISHADGYKTLYAHCSSVIKCSGSVSAGEVIASVGESGSATGPHLHFELHYGSLYLNPIYYVDIG